MKDTAPHVYQAILVDRNTDWANQIETLLQGSGTAFIAVGAEGAEFSSDGLTIAGNDARLVPDLRRNTAFVADWTGDSLQLQSNTLGAGLREFERR